MEPEVVDGGPLRTTETTTHVDGIAPASTSSTVSPSAGKGYARSVAANWNRYTVHLVASSNIEHYRASVTRAAQTLNSVAKTHLSVAAGQLKSVPKSPAMGHIYVVQSSNSGCGGSWAGCAESQWAYNAKGQTTATSSIVTIKGAYVNSYSTANTDHVVFHELGHAVGLDHYSPSYQGRPQVMHPSSYAYSNYQAGDRAGLTSLTSNSVHAPTGSLTLSGGSNTFDASGTAYDPDYNGQTAMKLTVDGSTVATNINNRWLTSGGVGVYGSFYQTFTDISAGNHTVKLLVQDKNSGAWSTLASKTVKVTGFTITTPKIRGVAATDRTLTAETGSWKPAGTRFLYRWLRDGKTIPGATTQTLATTPSMVGHTIAVRVTGFVTGLPNASKSSAAVKVAPASLTVSKAPTVASSPRVGEHLTVNAGTWTKGTTLRYQWYQDGKLFKGQTSPSLALNYTTRNHKYNVIVTGSKSGYNARAIRSNTTKAVAAGQIAAPANVTVTSPAKTVAYAQKLTAVRGAWTGGTTLRYQWYIDRTAIKGATASTYTMNRTDWIGHTTHVVITGTKTGYTTKTRTSPNYRLASGVLTAPAVTVTGANTVGQTLTAKPGTWTSGTVLRYQWSADGKPIVGATKQTLQLTEATAGKNITVTVTGVKANYTTTARTAAPVTVQPLATPSATPAATVPPTPAS